MEPRELRIGEIVQLNPETTKNKAFAGCLMVVSEPKSFGEMGYVQSLGTRQQIGGQAYYRVNFEDMEPTGGMAPWLIGSAADSIKEGIREEVEHDASMGVFDEQPEWEIIK